MEGAGSTLDKNASLFQWCSLPGLSQYVHKTGKHYILYTHCCLQELRHLAGRHLVRGLTRFGLTMLPALDQNPDSLIVQLIHLVPTTATTMKMLE